MFILIFDMIDCITMKTIWYELDNLNTQPIYNSLCPVQLQSVTSTRGFWFSLISVKHLLVCPNPIYVCVE